MIEGTIIKPLKKHCDERGFLCELLREDHEDFQKILPEGFKMCYYSVSPKGVIRAWHRHPKTQQMDTFIVLQGMAKVCVFNEETKELNEHFIGEENPVALTIPGKHWHGFKAISEQPVILLNFPDKAYNYKQPDEERLPTDTPKIPYNWTIKMK
jgi:dTDP-4-dehydrorhamnose 3,5-epimerase